MRRREARAARGALLIAITLLAAPACGGRSPARDAVPRIVLERAGAAGIWQVTYQLGEPATRLHFQRPANFYREEVWEVVTPGWRFGRRGDSQLLLAADGAPSAEEIAVRFLVFSENLTKEYELFGEFTDGSVAIYTGHLYAAAGDPPASSCGARTDRCRRCAATRRPPCCSI